MRFFKGEIGGKWVMLGEDNGIYIDPNGVVSKSKFTINDMTKNKGMTECDCRFVPLAPRTAGQQLIEKFDGWCVNTEKNEIAEAIDKELEATAKIARRAAIIEVLESMLSHGYAYNTCYNSIKKKLDET